VRDDWTKAAVDIRWSGEATWPAAPESVAMARDFVAAHLLTNLLPDLVDDARLVASELATNAVRHAGTAFTLSVDGRDGSITLRVRDGSRSLPSFGTSGILSTNGRGLMLVSALSVAWGVSLEAGGGKSVWARLGTHGR